MRRAYGYIRVSTKAQAGEDRMGVEAQKQAVQTYADQNGFTIVKWFIDEISGVKEDRPKLNDILYTDLPNQDKIEAVIAYKSDRIARDIKLYFYYLFVLERKNIKLLSVSEQFDEDNGLSTVFRALMLFVAEQERKNIALRTTAGRKVKSQQGGYAGGGIPYGYKIVDRSLVIEPSEAEMVRYIFDLGKYSYSLRDIADKVNEQGYRTRKGKLFTATGVQSILNNRKTYEGMYRYGKDGTWVKGRHEAILSTASRFDEADEEAFLNELFSEPIGIGATTHSDLDGADSDEHTSPDLDKDAVVAQTVPFVG